MKKNIIITLIQLFVLSSFAQTSSVRLFGSIKGLNSAEVALLDADNREIIRVKGKGDSLFIQADVVKGDGRAYYLYVPSLGKLGPSMNIPYIYFFIDNDSLEIKGGIEDKNLKKTLISNSPTMDQYEALYDKNPYQKTVSEVETLYTDAFNAYNKFEKKTEENRIRLKVYSDSLMTLYSKLSQSFLDMASTNKKSNALFLILQSTLPMETIDEIESVLEKFDSGFVQHNYYAKRLHEKLRLIRGSETGAVAPDFELKDLSGKEVKLSSLRGKYTLIDFWASWCGPCRREFPALKKLYADYKSKGLQIIGVSLDNDENAWRKAIKQEQLEYLQLLDSSMITKSLYNYTGIPFTVLISPEGKILAKQLRGEELILKVGEYIDSKPFEISVNLAKPYKGNVYLTCINDQLMTRLDSLQVDGSSFSFKGEITHPDQYRLVGEASDLDANICIEPGGHYQIDIDNDGNSVVKTSDGKEQLLINELLDITEAIDKEMPPLTSLYLRLKEEKKDNEAQQLEEQIKQNLDRSINSKISFIKKYPKSFAAIVVAGQLLTNDYPLLKEVYQVLDTVKYAYSHSWKSFKNKFQSVADKWLLNMPAPNFETKDINGNAVKLSDYKGRYLLLDFWASWCRPCRENMKELKKIYPQLHKKGIIVCSISVDEKREAWEKASREDDIVWTNTCEVKPFQSNEIARAYKISFVPALFLINPKGEIIRQNPSIEEILELNTE